MELRNIITRDNLGEGFALDNAARKINISVYAEQDQEGNLIFHNADGSTVVGSGFNCASIARLEQTEWDGIHGMSILVQDKDGVCKRLYAKNSVFANVGITGSANRGSGYTSDTFTVTFQVTNNGEDRNDKTILTLVIPESTELNPYTLTNLTYNANGVDRIVQIDQSHYEIYGLKVAGTATVKFEVTSPKGGAFQFTGNIDPGVIIGDVSSDNQATVDLNIQTKIDPGYGDSVECPAAIATDLATGKELVQVKLNSDGKTWPGINSRVRCNIFNSVESLAGRKFRFSAGSTVLIAGSTTNSGWQQAFTPDKLWTWPDVNRIDRVVEGPVNANSTITIPALTRYDETSINSLERGSLVSSRYFDLDPTTGVLTLHDDFPKLKYVVIFVRAAGQNCRWQRYDCWVGTKVSYDSSSTLTVTGLDEKYYNIKEITKSGSTITFEEVDTELWGSAIFLGDPVAYRINTRGVTSVSKAYTFEANLVSGQAYSFSLDLNGFQFPGAVGSAGYVSIVQSADGSHIDVNVDVKATSTDSLHFNEFDINIADV